MSLPPARPVTGVVVEATLRRTGDKLQVEYGVTNRGTEAVWLLDDMLGFGDKSYVRKPLLLLVYDDAAEPALVRLIRGVVHPRKTVMMPLVAAARRLEPGARATGVAETAWPLMVSHPQDRRAPLPVPPERAVLEVGAMTGDVPLEAAKLDDGGEAFVPAPGNALWHQQLVRSAVLALPA